MNVLRFIRRVIFGLCAVVGAIVVLFIVVSAITLRFFPEAQHPVPESAVLTLDLADGISERALFVIDKDGVIAWSYLSPIAVNPGADGILEALEGLTKGEQIYG